MNTQIQKYIKRDHKKIEGWYSQDALELIVVLSSIQISENITGALCEIGVHHGRSFVLLSLLSQSDETCIAIDLFESQGQNIENSGCGDKDFLLKNLKSNRCDLLDLVRSCSGPSAGRKARLCAQAKAVRHG